MHVLALMFCWKLKKIVSTCFGYVFCCFIPGQSVYTVTDHVSCYWWYWPPSATTYNRLLSPFSNRFFHLYFFDYIKNIFSINFKSFIGTMMIIMLMPYVYVCVCGMHRLIQSVRDTTNSNMNFIKRITNIFHWKFHSRLWRTSQKIFKMIAPNIGPKLYK